MSAPTAPIQRDWIWVNVIFFITTPLLAVTLIPYFFYNHALTWPLATMFVFGCIATSMSITTGYHRLFAHRTYEARSWVQFMLLFFGAGAFQGSALQWCSDHRRHHRHVDHHGDPYNINKGFWWAHMGWLFFDNPPDIRADFAPDLLQNRLVRLQHDYYIPLALFAGFLLPWGLGWLIGAPLGGLLLGGLARVVFTQHGTFLINSACHCFGRRPYSLKISARDSFWLAVLTYGEGYHNYHHQFQSDYRNGVRWYHWDPTKWVIRLLAYTGNAWKLRRIQPTEILKARLAVDEIRLLNHGVPVEKFASLRERVEDAGSRVRKVHEDYKRLKASMSKSSRYQLLELKTELKAARIELRRALQVWRQHYKSTPAM